MNYFRETFVFCYMQEVPVKHKQLKQMKITETKTTSVTFLFNKFEEYDTFTSLLKSGIDAVSNQTDSVTTEVVDSIQRNILSGKPFIPTTYSSEGSAKFGKLTTQ